MNAEEFQNMVASGRLTQAQVAKLLSLAPETFCIHRSWGFGKIHSYDLVLDQVLIDFKGKPQHPMKLVYAADSLQSVDEDHLMARKANRLEELKSLCKEKPEEVVRCFVQSFGENAMPERLEEVLCGEVIPAGEWKKWLSGAKRACKKDGLIEWPVKKTEPVRLLEKARTVQDDFKEQLSKARSLSALLDLAEEALKKISKNPEVKAVIPEIVKSLSDHIASQRDRDPSILIEATWVRDDLMRFMDASAEGSNIAGLVQEVKNLHGLISDLSAHRQRHILPILKQAFPDWEDRIRRLVDNASSNLLTEIVEFLMENGKSDQLQGIFENSLVEHRAGADLMIWLCKNREKQAYTSWIPNLINGRFLSAILSQLENMALEAGGRRKNPLAELLLNDATLVADLLRESDAEEARELGKSILMNPAIEELDKRSLMARLIKVSPSVQSLLVSSQTAASEALVVSWESLERRKNEYEEIINKKIPENSKEIAIARSYGDLRENHEFKAAKEMQTVLMRQKAELEQMLARARGTDFYKPDISNVNIGTKVTLSDFSGGLSSTMSILGAWDSDPARNILSYQTAVASALMGKKVGDEAVLPSESGERRVKIISIEPAVVESEESSPSESATATSTSV